MILVDVLWTNLHLPDSAGRLAEMARVAGLCEEHGGTVHWLQSGTLTAEGDTERVGTVSKTTIEVIPVTVLTCVVRWRGERKS